MNTKYWGKFPSLGRDATGKLTNPSKGGTTLLFASEAPEVTHQIDYQGNLVWTTQRRIKLLLFVHPNGKKEQKIPARL